MLNVSNTPKSKSQSGFSLVELLVVVAIIGVLAAAGVISYTKYISGSQDTVQESNASAIANALKTAQIARSGGLTVADNGCTSTAVISVSTGTTSSTQLIGNCAQSLVNNGSFKSAYNGTGVPTAANLILPNSASSASGCSGSATAGALVIVSSASGFYVAACNAAGNYVKNNNTTSSPGTDTFQFMGASDTF